MRGIAPISIIFPAFLIGAIAGYAIGDVRTGALAGLALGVILAFFGGSERMIVR